MITRVPTIDQSDMEFVYEENGLDNNQEKSRIKEKCLKRGTRICLAEREDSSQEDFLQDYLTKVRLLTNKPKILQEDL